MHIQPINICLPFQKKLVATAQIRNNEKPQEVKIYQLDKESDVEILERALDTKEWLGSYYLPDLNVAFGDDFSTYNYYAMLDNKGKLLCTSVVNERGNTKNKLEFIETAPRKSLYNKAKRKTRYIGETMLAFIAKKGKKEKKELVVPTVADREKTKNFYFTQCGFAPFGKRGAKINIASVDSFVRKNENHTGGQIKIL